MIRRLAYAASGVLLALAAPDVAAAADVHVGMSGRAFSPARPVIVAGDTVHWRNTDFADHTVTGGPLASGRLSPGDAYSHRFGAVGSQPYVCTLHTFMRGEVQVTGALLEASGHEVVAGSPVTLRGRAPAGSAQVTIERLGEGGGPVAAVTPQPDGSFTATVHPDAGASYRAVSEAGASPPVTVEVLAAVRVRLAVHRGKRRDHLQVSTRPPAPGLTARLQLYSRERFSWRQAAHRRLDDRGRATFRLRAGIRRRARVVLVTAGNPVPVATSASVRLWRAGGVRAPRHGGAPAGGGHGGGGEHPGGGPAH